MFDNLRRSRSAAVTRTITLLVLAAALSSAGFAQERSTSYNFVDYINAQKAGFPSAQVQVINPGSTGGTSPSGDLCANVYVFSHNQQMLECCSCKVTPDGLRTFSVNTDLTINPLTPAAVPNGVIKIVPSQAPATSTCAISTAASTYVPFGTLGAWITHVHKANGTFSVSEKAFQTASLSQTELSTLQNHCLFISTTGSAVGICTCGIE
jgi:hypothetical protein